MKKEIRVLVVEDQVSVLSQLLEGFKFANIEAFGAKTFEEAKKLIDEFCFNVALIDLHLKFPIDESLEGLDLINKIVDINEGTYIIIISGQKDTQLAADSIALYKADKYISKDTLREIGMKGLIEKVEEANKQKSIRIYGSKKDAIDFLRGDLSEAIWVDWFLQNFKPIKSYSGLKSFFNSFINPLAPIIPPKDERFPLKIDKQKNFVSGKFWSKGLGYPIEILVCQPQNKDEEKSILNKIGWEIRNSEKSFEKSNINGYLFKLDKKIYQRSEFK